MSIEWKRCPVIDGKAYPTVEEAKKAQLESLFLDAGLDPWTPKEIANWILNKEAEILNVLTFTEASRPKARKANGAVRKSRKNGTPAPDAAKTLNA